MPQRQALELKETRGAAFVTPYRSRGAEAAASAFQETPKSGNRKGLENGIRQPHFSDGQRQDLASKYGSATEQWPRLLSLDSWEQETDGSNNMTTVKGASLLKREEDSSPLAGWSEQLHISPAKRRQHCVQQICSRDLAWVDR